MVLDLDRRPSRHKRVKVEKHTEMLYSAAISREVLIYLKDTEEILSLPCIGRLVRRRNWGSELAALFSLPPSSAFNRQIDKIPLAVYVHPV